MASPRSISPLFRTFMVLGAVGIITTAVTFAALQSQNAVLSSNTISTSTAFLLVSTDNLAFNNTKPGFTFSNVTPGGAATPANGYSFYLKNTGTANLGIKVAVGTAPSNPNSVDLSKVFVDFTRTETGLTQNLSLKSLVDSYATGGTALNDIVNAGTTGQYSVKVSMTSDAYSGSSGATISGVDLSFSGLGS